MQQLFKQVEMKSMEVHRYKTAAEVAKVRRNVSSKLLYVYMPVLLSRFQSLHHNLEEWKDNFAKHRVPPFSHNKFVDVISILYKTIT